MEFRNIVKGLLIASINAYLKGSGETKIVFSADELAKAAGYDNAQSEEARKIINKALQALLSISISYEEPDIDDETAYFDTRIVYEELDIDDETEYFDTRIVSATRLTGDNCYISLVEEVVSLFRFIEV